METFLIIIGSFLVVLLAKKVYENQQEDPYEADRAQFINPPISENRHVDSTKDDDGINEQFSTNTSKTIIENNNKKHFKETRSNSLEYFTANKAKAYYFEQKKKGVQIDDNTYRLLANIIGKEYEDQLLRELENLHSSSLGRWINEKHAQGLFFSYSVYNKIRTISQEVNAQYAKTEKEKRESPEAINRIELEKTYIFSLSANDLCKHLDLPLNAQLEIDSLEFHSSSNYQINGFYYVGEEKYRLSKSVNFHYPGTTHYHEGYKFEKEGLLENAISKYQQVLESDGDPLLFYHTAERGSIVLRKLKRYKDDLEFLYKCVEKLGSLPTYAGSEFEHIEYLKGKLNARIQKSQTKIK